MWPERWPAAENFSQQGCNAHLRQRLAMQLASFSASQESSLCLFAQLRQLKSPAHTGTTRCFPY
jgi:hypothetical protein